MNGVISNGRAPRIFSIVGSVTSVNCTWQLGHQEMTPVFAFRQLVERAGGLPAGRFEIAGAQLDDAAAMVRPAHHAIGDAERIHDVEREQRDVRRLQHVAAGIEDEVRPLAPCASSRVEPRREPARAARAASSVSCMRESMATPSATRRKWSMPRLRRSRKSVVFRALSAARAIASRKRGLTPSGQASMQSPLERAALRPGFGGRRTLAACAGCRARRRSRPPAPR